MTLRVLDLCAGIGGISLGLQQTGGFETVAFCEIDPYCRKVLAKHWPGVPCYEDVKNMKGTECEAIDVICGGYPCQPFSKVGKRRGDKDPRHLWPHFSRIIGELRPAWFIGENVANHVNVGVDQVLSDLAAQDYTARAFLIPACGVDAPHKRERCWVIASNNDPDSHSKRPHRAKIDQQRDDEPNDRKVSKSGQVCEILAKSRSTRISGACSSGGVGFTEWLPEPGVGRMANGFSARVDRIKGLGNAVSPKAAYAVGMAVKLVASGSNH